jgi:hypothetical protein
MDPIKIGREKLQLPSMGMQQATTAYIQYLRV